LHPDEGGRDNSPRWRLPRTAVEVATVGRGSCLGALAFVDEIGLESPIWGMCRASLACTMLAYKRLPPEGAGKGDYAVRGQVHKYEIDIFWSDEDRCFIACVPDLGNCAAWGDTYEEALAQAHVAIRADLVSREKFGEPIPEPTPRLLV
jgi:predicted RNase H-like HicB family nuclease